MTTKYQQDGNVIEYTAGSAVSSGDVIAINDMVGVALADIAASATGSVRITGVFATIAKVAGTAWNQGDAVDWDASASAFGKGITTAAGDVTTAGIAFEAAASGDTTAVVMLTPGAGTGI
ncbi:MAG: recombinase RecA [endosymbiont of Escarpia spicata]|uniref:Recombinase RecA n=1 Tax=endosymbiont of Escarpia spicata TaxID=2200908 RepID=A0A370DN96_9GAMM|nr:MAG: recombinase RecA [endosymbiont of Escarpia spicata]